MSFLTTRPLERIVMKNILCAITMVLSSFFAAVKWVPNWVGAFLQGQYELIEYDRTMYPIYHIGP